MTTIQAREILRVSSELVSPPEVFTRLRTLLDDPDWTPEAVGRVIENDPALSARLLRVVNSPLYGLAQPVDSIPRGIGLVGADELGRLALATSVMRAFHGIPDSLFNVSRFWQESLRDAVLAKVIADAHPHRRRLEPAFLAALLAGIGQLVLFRVVPELARSALERAEHRDEPLAAAEEAVVGCNHDEVGLQLMRDWRLPVALVQPVAARAGEAVEADHAPLVEVVELAAKINETVYLGTEEVADPLAAIQVLPHWERLGLDAGSLGDLLLDAESRFDAAVGAMLSA